MNVVIKYYGFICYALLIDINTLQKWKRAVYKRVFAVIGLFLLNHVSRYR